MRTRVINVTLTCTLILENSHQSSSAARGSVDSDDSDRARSRTHTDPGSISNIAGVLTGPVPRISCFELMHMFMTVFSSRACIITIRPCNGRVHDVDPLDHDHTARIYAETPRLLYNCSNNRIWAGADSLTRQSARASVRALTRESAHSSARAHAFTEQPQHHQVKCPSYEPARGREITASPHVNMYKFIRIRIHKI